MQHIGTHSGDVMHFRCVCFRGGLSFLDCDDICMCVVNKQFELLEFVFESVYVDVQYDEISLNFTAGTVSLCCVCSHVVVLFVVRVCILRECEWTRVTAMLGWGTEV